MKIGTFILCFMLIPNTTFSLSLKFETEFTLSRFQLGRKPSLLWLNNDSFITVGYEDAPLVWDSHDGAFLFSFEGHPGIIKTANLSLDRTQFAVAGENSLVTIWDTQTAEILYSISTPSAPITSLTFSQDAITVVADNSIVYVIQVETGEILLSIDMQSDDISTAYTLENGIIAVGSISNFTFWDFQTGELQKIVDTEDRSLGLFDIQRANYFFVKDGVFGLYLYDLQMEELFFNRTDLPAHIASLRIIPEIGYIVTGLADGTLSLWRISPLQEESRIQAHDTELVSLDFSSDGNKLLTLDQNNKVKVWSILQKSKIFNWFDYP